MRQYIAAFIIFVILSAAAPAYESAAAGLFSNLTLEMLPQTPGPFTSVAFKASGYGFDINNSYTTWTLNGKTAKKGVGIKDFSLTTEGAGSSYAVALNIVTQNGDEFKKEISFSIGDVDMLWHTNTYVPKYYPAKPLLTKKAGATVTAMPFLYKNGKKISPVNLSYKWKLNGKVNADASGFNKQSFSFFADGIQNVSQTVEVEVSDSGGTIRAVKSLTLSPMEPEVVFYAKHPLEGTVYRKAVTEFNTASGGSDQFVAVPFYFSTSDPNVLSYEWSANSVKAAKDGTKNYLFNFNSIAGAAGKVVVSLNALNEQNPFQKAHKTFTINVE